MLRPRRRERAVEALRHEEDTRTNIPTAEYQSMVREEQATPLQKAYQRRNRDLDPQLVWRGKDEQDLSDLVVNVPPLYIQEKVHPKALIADLMRQSQKGRQDEGTQLDMFADFNGLPEGADRTDFYQHDGYWSNRMILGDSLQVMASLAEREGLQGRVQCIYIDPPYGIRFNSNFQWSTTSRDVRDGNAAHITREPEQVKAFRDTWCDGIHSYLTYLRDRLTVARDLLADSGSIFVQIGDENVHRVRALMDEVFGEGNFISQISFTKTSGFSTNYLPNISDQVLWYGKKQSAVKFRQLAFPKRPGEAGATSYRQLAHLSGSFFKFDASRLARSTDLTSQGGSQTDKPLTIMDKTFVPNRGMHWKTTTAGLERFNKASRLGYQGRTAAYLRFIDDFPVFRMTNQWNDTGTAGFASEKSYVVQTLPKVIERCILMTTDPGDLVLDPTCGSGTTAYVAEQWGRRWITIDTSRVALALARARIMGARYPYYILADSRDGQVKEAELSRRDPSQMPTYGNVRQGFVYERVPHITLRDIANNAEIDVIYEEYQQELEPIRAALNAALETEWEEWEIPRDADEAWSADAQDLHERWWELRIKRQQEIDASIAAHAEYEYLYDKPYEDRSKVRVAGPFTVESISPHRVLGVDENGDVLDGIAEPRNGYGTGYDFGAIILDNLRRSGVQQAHREDRISFTSLMPWPGRLVCASGQYSVVSGQGPDGEGNGEELDTDHQPLVTAGIFIGPEFGTVSRPDLVEAAREAAECGFDVLIACAFNYDAHTTEFESLGRVPVLKARMNADLHMAGELKNTGNGNLFVIFGEPDVSVASSQWLVTGGGRMVANYEHVKELSGLGSLEEINRSGRDGLSRFCSVPAGRAVRDNGPGAAVGSVDSGEHSGRSGAPRDQGVSELPRNSQRVVGGNGDISNPGPTAGNAPGDTSPAHYGPGVGSRANAQRTQTLAAIQGLKDSDFPLSLTTDHWLQVTVNGVDVFHPNTGEVRSDGPEGIACWFIDTDYNQESFFVRHAYFLGASDPYRSLKTTLKAEIDADAWATLNSDTSRPFPRPETGRIAVKVINHLGDEVMKVFRVG